MKNIIWLIVNAATNNSATILLGISYQLLSTQNSELTLFCLGTNSPKRQKHLLHLPIKSRRWKTTASLLFENATTNYTRRSILDSIVNYKLSKKRASSMQSQLVRIHFDNLMLDLASKNKWTYNFDVLLSESTLVTYSLWLKYIILSQTTDLLYTMFPGARKNEIDYWLWKCL